MVKLRNFIKVCPIIINRNSREINIFIYPSANIKKLLPYFCKPDFIENVSFLMKFVLWGVIKRKLGRGVICEYWYI